MSNWERHGGTRDLSLSRWHRQFLRAHAASRIEAEECGMIDIDWLEFCARCKTNLFLAEAARDVRKLNKCADQTAQLAGQANIPAYLVLYEPTGEGCPVDRQCRDEQCQHGINKFRVRQVAPSPPGDWRWETPESFADFVLSFHRMHRITVCASRFSGGSE
jgi:hypothetical protein